MRAIVRSQQRLFSRFRATRFSAEEKKRSLFIQVLFCTDISVVIWVYGIFRTLGYLV
ncbi:hypothetical protein F511_08012 [Dorcoceras hygrometricum]|uniref:Uncharacterized protein n=1 Tax=Dorcoceras hygrometricum TaxID=472368 RepID=A0A2Z7CLD7_9LAMI|nr:hypothetical protein F511_08012 [Dorcoceras hygrometricum]